MKVSDYVMKFLADKGIEYMFFLPGGGCMHLLDSLGRNEQIKHISLLHEQAASVAAEAYASFSEKESAVLVTTGPGATNAVTAVQSSYLDSVPVFFVSGQVKTSDLKDQFGLRGLGNQEAGIVDIVKSITKYSVMVKDKDDIKYHLERAWFEMTTGRKGPVWIDIPLDIQGSQINPEELKGFTEKEVKSICSDEEISKAIEMINAAKRPVIMTGSGLLYCQKQFKELSDYLNIPIIPSWKFPDLVPNNHPLYIGRCGTLGERAANFAMQSADLIISIGCHLDFSMTGYDKKAWATKAKKIIIDIDKAEIDKQVGVKAELPIICDAKDVIEKLIQRKSEIKVNDLTEWKEKIKSWRKKYPLFQDKYLDDTEGLSLYTCVKKVTDVVNKLEKEVVFCASNSGVVAEIFFQSIELRDGQKLRGSHNLGSMGYDIPQAIGAYYATGKEVICFAGDGGMQLNIQELATIAGRKLPIKIFVSYNGGYGSIQNMQRNHFKGYYVASTNDSGLYIPDMKVLALAYGFKVYKAGTIVELNEVVKNTLEEEGPTICLLHVDPMCLVEPRSATQVMADGSLKSSSLENQYPFLDEEEVERNLK